MAELNKITPKKILWIDLEMTGLDPANDRIVEAAAIVTDWDFAELASFESAVRQDKAVIDQRLAASPFWASRPQAAQEIMQLALAGAPEKEVEASILKLVDKFFAPGEPVLLAGNSIYCDRGFIKQWWPTLESRLHYRMLDVTAWKVVAIGKFGLDYPKKEAHRALSDIRESIAELQFYIDHTKFGK